MADSLNSTCAFLSRDSADRCQNDQGFEAEGWFVHLLAGGVRPEPVSTDLWTGVRLVGAVTLTHR
jgi:hypothetical protein